MCVCVTSHRRCLSLVTASFRTTLCNSLRTSLPLNVDICHLKGQSRVPTTQQRVGNATHCQCVSLITFAHRSLSTKSNALSCYLLSVRARSRSRFALDTFARMHRSADHRSLLLRSHFLQQCSQFSHRFFGFHHRDDIQLQ